MVVFSFRLFLIPHLMLFVQASVSYDDLVHRLVNYQSQMSARNVILQGQLNQLTRYLSQPTLHELELAEAEKALKERCEALRETTSILQQNRDKANHRVEFLATELVDYRIQLQEVAVGQVRTQLEVD